MTVWIVVGLIVFAYFLGRSRGFEAGSKKAQEYVLEIKKKK